MVLQLGNASNSSDGMANSTNPDKIIPLGIGSAVFAVLPASFGGITLNRRTSSSKVRVITPILGGILNFEDFYGMMQSDDTIFFKLFIQSPACH